MSPARRRDLHERPPRGFTLPDSVLTLSSDIPDGMTIAEYRRARPRPPSRGARLRLAARSRLRLAR